MEEERLDPFYFTLSLFREATIGRSGCPLRSSERRLLEKESRNDKLGATDRVRLDRAQIP